MLNENMIIKLILCALLGYVLGCISPSFIIGRIKGYDVRKQGSGNAGASNTVLLAGKAAGLFVALADICKAALAWHIGSWLLPGSRLAPVLAGVCCILGHMFPLFLSFKGGKGLACLGGVVLGFGVVDFLIMLAVAFIVALISNYVAVVTVTMSVVFPIYYCLKSSFLPGTLLLMLPILPIVLRHSSNFRRIRAGTELRLSYLWNKNDELERTGHGDRKN